ncbi:hypothetical protein BX600DRAFT_512103 [Xylariales sp. PMI_506]|nr:hypothetical protein BX600DRAFT_512103 [Xylariales sp. PMI_506]
MVKLAFVGACYIDTILSVSNFPEEDAKLRASSLQVRRGGNGPNSLEVLQQLLTREASCSIEPYLVSVLPSEDSAAVGTVRASFGPGSPVNLTRCIYRSSSTPASSYVIRSKTTGSRTIINHNDLPDMTVDEFIAAASGLDGKSWWHFEGRIPNTTLQCIQHLRNNYPEAGISVEVEMPGRAGLEDLVAAADVVFYSKSWAQSKAYTSAQECLEAQSSVAHRA